MDPDHIAIAFAKAAEMDRADELKRAAAPELYEALARLLAFFCVQTSTAPSDWKQGSAPREAVAALSRARGEVAK